MERFEKMSEIVYSQDVIKAKDFNMPIISMQDQSVKHILLMGSVGYGISNEQEIESAHMIEHLVGALKSFLIRKHLVILCLIWAE
jgi:hypothetical protein